jgi:phosphatidylglycerophosphate synthase
MLYALIRFKIKAMKHNKQQTAAQKRIRSSRERSHLLKKLEFKTIDYLCSIMPHWVTPDGLTLTGISGSIMVAIGMLLAINNPSFLFLSVLGFAIQWFGDSLDGRIAYYRNTPRKWYGWSLDINADWISISAISLAFYCYLPQYKFIAILFALAYGGAMILSLLNYKLTDQYVIDKGLFGPTEMRIFISLAIIVEFFHMGTLAAFAAIASLLLIASNIADSIQLMRNGDKRDESEKALKSNLVYKALS